MSGNLHIRNLGCLIAWLSGATVVLACSSLLSAAPPSIPDFKKDIQPILAQYCYDCHGDGEKKGKVAFDEFKTLDELRDNHDLWWRALKNLRAGLMPPPKKDRPSPDQIHQIEQWIKYGSFALDPSN